MSIPTPSATSSNLPSIDETAEVSAPSSPREKALAALLHGPLLTTLLRLALPTVMVLFTTIYVSSLRAMPSSPLPASCILLAREQAGSCGQWLPVLFV